MVNAKEIIDKYSLRIENTIHSTSSKSIYFLVGENGERFVLKMYKYDRANSEIEQKFLSAVKHRKFEYIRFPNMIAHGNNYILVDYVEREHVTRDTILERQWSPDDVRLWVSGLREFQNIDIPSHYFSVKQRYMGIIYPVCRLLLLLPKCRELINLRAWGVVFKIVLNYSMARFSFKNALTHYDLQMYNYAFMSDKRKMSMLDFELSYYRGDPLFDVLYYISIPIRKFKDWTFQIDLLKEYIKQEYEGTWHSKSLLCRIRLILLVSNLSRYLGFINDSDKKKIYSENIRILLDSKSFSRWVASFSG